MPKLLFKDEEEDEGLYRISSDPGPLRKQGTMLLIKNSDAQVDDVEMVDMARRGFWRSVKSSLEHM